MGRRLALGFILAILLSRRFRLRCLPTPDTTSVVFADFGFSRRAAELNVLINGGLDRQRFLEHNAAFEEIVAIPELPWNISPGSSDADVVLENITKSEEH